LLQYPQQFELLRADPSLLLGAVEEMIRWVTPTKTMMRTAASDYELHGVEVEEGQQVLLLYPSGNPIRYSLRV
jgi:cytochrome P450